MRTDPEARRPAAPALALTLTLALVLTLALALVNCGRGQDQRQARALAGTVVVGIAEAPESLDPRVGTSVASYRLHQLLYNQLVTQDAEGRLVPDLAESWEERIDGEGLEARQTWTFRLRRGVRFHDGRPLSADDVVYTFHSLLAPGFASHKRAAFADVVEVSAEAPATVVFTLAKPQPWFLANLGAVGIVPRGFPADGSRAPVGTGPFSLRSRDGSRRFELAANDNYFRGRPSVRSLVLRVIPDDTTRALELMHGSVDLVINDMAVSAVESLRERPRLEVLTAPGLSYEYIGINHRHPDLGRRRVRQAIAHAIDRGEIIREFLGGLARPAVGPLMPRLWALPVEFRGYDYDPERAEDLLEAAGYSDPDGPGPEPRLRLVLKCSSRHVSRDLAVIFRQQLARVGIAVEIRPLEFQTYYADIIAGNFELFQLRWVGIIDPHFFGSAFHSTSVPGSDGGRERGSFNRGRYANPEVDRLIERAEREREAAERWRVVAELQQLLSEDLPYVDLWYRDNFAVFRSDLEGVELTLNASFAPLYRLHYRDR